MKRGTARDFEHRTRPIALRDRLAEMANEALRLSQLPHFRGPNAVYGRAFLDFSLAMDEASKRMKRARKLRRQGELPVEEES